jgi:hypothetical protein
MIESAVIASQRVARMRARSQAPRSNPWIGKGSMDASSLCSSQRRQNTRPRSRGAMRPRLAYERCPSKQRAQGMPGARRARSLVGRKKQPHQRSHHGHTGNTRHSPRNGFNKLLRALPGEPGFLATVVCGYGMSAPGRADFASARLEHQRRGVRTTRLRRTLQRRSSACR